MVKSFAQNTVYATISQDYSASVRKLVESSERRRGSPAGDFALGAVLPKWRRGLGRVTKSRCLEDKERIEQARRRQGAHEREEKEEKRIINLHRISRDRISRGGRQNFRSGKREPRVPR